MEYFQVSPTQYAVNAYRRLSYLPHRPPSLRYFELNTLRFACPSLIQRYHFLYIIHIPTALLKMTSNETIDRTILVYVCGMPAQIPTAKANELAARLGLSLSTVR